MKKIIIILSLIVGLSGYCQKSLEIYNYSSQSITLINIVTKPPTGTYPWYASVAPSEIVVPAGGEYILQNASNIYSFPFYSPASVPVITNWRYVVQSSGSNGSFTNITSQTAYAQGTNQTFNYLLFNVNNGYSGGGTSGLNNPIVQNFTNHWEANHDLYTNGNTSINTIVFFDI